MRLGITATMSHRCGSVARDAGAAVTEVAQVRLSRFGGDAGLYGAALLAVQLAP